MDRNGTRTENVFRFGFSSDFSLDFLSSSIVESITQDYTAITQEFYSNVTQSVTFLLSSLIIIIYVRLICYSIDNYQQAVNS